MDYADGTDLSLLNSISLNLKVAICIQKSQLKRRQGKDFRNKDTIIK